MSIISNKKHALVRLLCILVCCVSLLPVNAAEQSSSAKDESLIFGFLPIVSKRKLISRFKPLSDYLSLVLGQPVRFETAPNYTIFIQRTREKRYDILFTAPHFYYLANRNADYRAIVRVGAPDMKAIIVATRKSGITLLKDLKGKRISTPDALSLGTILIRNKFRSIGLDPDKDLSLVASPSHNSSLQAANLGLTNAAGLMIPPFKRAAPEIREQMLELGKTKGSPHMPIAVSSKLSTDKADLIMQALTKLKSSKKGRSLLKHLSWPMGFVKTKPGEYDQLNWVVKELNLNKE